MAKIFLGVDFGTKRIGLARSYGTLAEPLSILENDEHIWDQLAEVLGAEKIDEVVMGVSENTMAANARAFGAQLHARFQLPVHYWDETLTTVEAKAGLQAAGKKIDPRQLDDLSASLILQDYLEMNPEAPAQ